MIVGLRRSGPQSIERVALTFVPVRTLAEEFVEEEQAAGDFACDSSAAQENLTAA